MFKQSASILTLALLVVVIPLSKSSFNLDEGLLIRFVILSIVNFLLLGLLLYKGYSRINLKSGTILWIYLSFVLYAITRTLIGEFNGDSIFQILKLSSYCLLLYQILFNFSMDQLRRYLPVLFSILGSILVLLGSSEIIMIIKQEKFEIPLTTYQITTVFGHRNLYLQVLFFTFPFIVYQSLVCRKRLFSVLYIIVAVLSFAVLLVLSNRSVWIAISISMVTNIILSFFYYKKRGFKMINRMKVVRLSTIFLAGMILSIIFFSVFTVENSAEEHMLEIANHEKGSGKDRLGLWERSLMLISEKPIFGHGAASWKVDVLKYGNKDLISENNVTYYQRPHNDLLWITCEYGIPGIIFYSLTMVIALLVLIRAVLSGNGAIDLFALSMLSVLMGFMIFSFFSFPHERIIHNIILVIVLAVSIKIPEKQIPDRNRTGLIIVLPLSLIIIVLSAFTGVKRYLSEMHLRSALELRNSGQEYLTRLNMINTSFYPMDLMSTPISWYKGVVYYTNGDFNSAFRYFLESYELNPYHVHVLNNLGAVYLEKGNSDKAMEFFGNAVSINSNFDEARFNLISVMYNNGEYGEAFNELFLIQDDSSQKFLQYLSVITPKVINEYKIDMANTIIEIPDNQLWYFDKYIESEKDPDSMISIIFEELIDKPE